MRIIAILTLTMVLAACGGGAGGDGNETLNMRGFDIRASDYQAVIRAEMAANPASFSTVCQQVNGLSDAAAVTFFKQLSASSGATPEVPSGGTAKPGQTVSDASGLKAVKIIQAECDRTF